MCVCNSHVHGHMSVSMERVAYEKNLSLDVVLTKPPDLIGALLSESKTNLYGELSLDVDIKLLQRDT